MPDDSFTLRQADQARTDFAISIKTELEAIHARLARMPTQKEIWRAALAGMLGGSGLMTLLFLALSH